MLPMPHRAHKGQALAPQPRLEQLRACDPRQDLLSVALGVIPHVGGQKAAPQCIIGHCCVPVSADSCGVAK